MKEYKQRLVGYLLTKLFFGLIITVILSAVACKEGPPSKEITFGCRGQKVFIQIPTQFTLKSDDTSAFLGDKVCKKTFIKASSTITLEVNPLKNTALNETIEEQKKDIDDHYAGANKSQAVQWRTFERKTVDGFEYVFYFEYQFIDTYHIDIMGSCHGYFFLIKFVSPNTTSYKPLIDDFQYASNTLRIAAKG